VNKHTFWQAAYAVGAVASATLVVLSVVGLFIDKSLFTTLWGLAYGIGLSVANTKWFLDERRQSAAQQSGGVA
jgi:hypothetical protein